jgi:hypothetical protein
MGNGLFNPPPGPTTGPPLPDIPIPSFQSIGQDFASGTAKEGLWEHFWNVFKHMLFEASVFVLTQIGSFAEAFASLIADVYVKLEAQNSPGFFALIASLVGDFLQTDVSGQALQDRFRHGGDRAALNAIGSVFIDNLNRILQGGGQALPWMATDVPAREFMGFLISFAINAANSKVLTSLIPEEFRVGEGFAAFGDDLSRNLGFGRLSRQAFLPFIKIMVADPLEAALNAAWTPKRLSEGQYVQAFVRGDIDAGQLRQYLSELGYHQRWDAFLIAQHTKELSLGEIVNFIRVNSPSSAPPTGALQLLGYSPTNATNVWTATMEALIDPLRKQFLNELTNEIRRGEIDLATAQGILSSLNLFPAEAAWYTQIWNQMLSFPRRRLSEAQVEKAFLEGLMDMTAVQQYWTQSGYSFADIQTLSLLLLQRLQGGTKTKAGTVGRRHLTEPEIEKAVKAGVITLTQAQEFWTNLGYSATDIAILSSLVGAAAGGTVTQVGGVPT